MGAAETCCFPFILVFKIFMIGIELACKYKQLGGAELMTCTYFIKSNNISK